MIEPRRLFDCVDFQLQKFPRKDMLAAKVNGKWISHSTEEVKEIVTRFSAGLLQLGVSANDGSDEGTDKIAIISNNRPEWVFTDLAVQQTGAVLVPIYPTTNANELQFILNDALVKYIFFNGSFYIFQLLNVCNRGPVHHFCPVIGIFYFIKRKNIL